MSLSNLGGKANHVKSYPLDKVQKTSQGAEDINTAKSKVRNDEGTVAKNPPPRTQGWGVRQ